MDSGSLQGIVDSAVGPSAGPPGVEWSVELRDADTDAVLATHDAGRVQHTASVGKLFLLATALRQVEAGDLALDEPLARGREHWVADSGLWYRLAVETLPMGDVAALVGAVSDNLATNVLLQRVGLEAVAECTRALGFEHSALLDFVRDERTPADPPTLSVGSATELARFMAMLHRGEIVSSAASRQILDWLAAGTDLSMLAAAFGLDPLAHVEADRGIVLRHKTGTISTARVDTGLVGSSGGATVAYAVLAQWPADTAGDPRDAVLAAMRAIGEGLRERLGATGPASGH